jgi:hypothetical protein
MRRGRWILFAILLIPIDEWYIIPFAAMGKKNCSIHFTPKSKRQKYGRYREAWELLRGVGVRGRAAERRVGLWRGTGNQGSSLRPE